MYDRAPRQASTRIRKSCSPGPGSYDFHLDSPFVEYPADNIAPFLSTSCQLEVVKPEVDVGPTSYTLRNQFGVIPGGNFWISRSERFKNRDSSVKRRHEPSVDFGNPMFQQRFKPETPVKIHFRKPLKRDKKDLLIPPSIPDHESKYGYDYAENGELCKMLPPNDDKTLGPAYYKVPLDNPSTTSCLYKGCCWSRHTSDNKSYPDSNPGPGRYNLTLPPVKELAHFPKEPLAVPRFMQSVIDSKKKDDIPGPGTYSIQDPFAMKLMDFCRKRPAFQSSSQRFKRKTEPILPSCVYQVKEEPTSCSLNQFNIAPFGSQSERFSDGETVAPAPNEYNIKSFIDETELKIIRSKLNRKVSVPGFGTSSVRHCQLPTQVDKKYIQRMTDKKETIRQIIIPKRKKTQTKRRIPTKITFPEPGDHDVAHVFDYLRTPTSHRRTAKGKIDRVCFLSGRSRFPDKKIKRPKKCPKIGSDSPGPGSYDVRVDEFGRKKGLRFSTDDRFPREETAPWPTVATYKMAPWYMDTMLQGTFNQTLNSVLPQNFGNSWRPPKFFYCFSPVMATSVPFTDCVYRV